MLFYYLIRVKYDKPETIIFSQKLDTINREIKE